MKCCARASENTQDRHVCKVERESERLYREENEWRRAMSVIDDQSVGRCGHIRKQGALLTTACLYGMASVKSSIAVGA